MPKRILLADDSITIQKVVELTFSDGDYEVVAVNNGAKAIQKLSEMRPDIILSDIIMPEKNGYEVCEYVKSHPELRNIPVVLLTGTFEPFDPDRADKAGCDAVVTKPFESQSLIQRVEELIDQARAAAAPVAAPPEPEPASFATEPEPTPWDEPAPAAESAFSPSGFSTAAMPAADPFSSGFATNDNDIFGTSPHPKTTEIPFEGTEPSFGGETRAFPRMSFDELQQMANAPAPTPEPEPPAAAEPTSPWDEPAAAEPPSYGGETRAFPSLSFDELQSMQSAPASTPEQDPEPLAGPEAEAEPPAYGGETRAFPRMSFDELQQMASTPAATPEPEPEPTSPWDEPAAPSAEPPAYGGETRAFPRMSLEELQSMQSTAEPTSPWDEPAQEPAASEAEPLHAAPEPEPEPIRTAEEPSSPWDVPAAEPESPFAAAPSAFDESPAFDEPSAFNAPAAFDEPAAFEEPAAFNAPAAFDEPAAYSEPPAFNESAAFDDTSAFPSAPPFASVHEPEPEPVTEREPEHPSWSHGPAPEPQQPELAAIAAVTAEVGGDLSEDQIERIARRVVQLMSEQVVRNIAWEVIPDMAEIAVKARIRELESEA
ncbi:MAG: response regulator receiver protein [Acidobacteria bacterium]|nr:response regulator receiver protein [Acidobacteriota bacterium]